MRRVDLVRSRHIGVGAILSTLLPSLLSGQSRPTEPYTERDVCPFECCTYGEWTAQQNLQVYQRAENESQVIGTLRPGDKFTASTGLLRHRRIEVVVAEDPVDRFQRGDTLLVLGYSGEGYYTVWHNGSIMEGVPQFWPSRNFWKADPHYSGTVIREGVVEWWVRVTMNGGAQGWIPLPYLDGSFLPVDGADACGGAGARGGSQEADHDHTAHNNAPASQL